MSAVHQQEWILTRSPYDSLIHVARINAWNLSTIVPVCLDSVVYVSRSRQHYEVHDAIVSCLFCLAVT